MIESMREDFEAWYESLNYRKPEIQLTPSSWYYPDSRVDDAWSAWQASRAALCVELPVKLYGYSGQPQEDRLIDADRNFVIDQCSKAIHAAGVKTK